MAKALILLLLVGCAGTKLNVGAKYDVLDNELGATSQFFPSAEASIKQDDVYGAFFWFEFPIGEQPVQRMHLENSHELRDPVVVTPNNNHPDKSDVEAGLEAVGKWDPFTLVVVLFFGLAVLVALPVILKSRAKAKSDG